MNAQISSIIPKNEVEYNNNNNNNVSFFVTSLEFAQAKLARERAHVVLTARRIVCVTLRRTT